MKNNTTKDVFATLLAKSVAAGQTDCVIPLGTAELRAEYDRKFLKCIKADELLDLCGGSVTTAYGITVSGFAFWADTQATEINGYIYRHRLLALCRPDGCRVYAIPASLTEKKFALPDIELSEDELDTYRLIANHISPQSQEYTCTVHHPAKTTIKNNRELWDDEPLDCNRLSQLLQEHGDWLLPLITAALDVQFRSFAACKKVPIFYYNFTLSKANMQADTLFMQVMTALNLTGEGECCNAAPMEIIAQDNDGFKPWFNCHDRMVIIRTGKGRGIEKLFEVSNYYQRQLSYGGILPSRLPTVPIIRSKIFFDRSDTLDCALPDKVPELTEQYLDGLRSAVSRTLTGRNARAVVEQWHKRMGSRQSYRLLPFEEWRNAILYIFCATVFSEDVQAKQDAVRCTITAQQLQREAEAEREAIIQKALNLVEDQERYASEIIGKPASIDEVNRQLYDEQNAVAFRHNPTTGECQGQHFIIFTDRSLKRLTQRAGMTEELYPAFKKRAKKQGVMAYTSKTVKFGKLTLNGFWFYDKKF